MSHFTASPSMTYCKPIWQPLNREIMKEQAAIALRQLYMQTLETTLAVLCCTLQSPAGLPMWTLMYSNGDLKNAVNTLKQGERLPGMHRDFEFTAYAESIIRRALHPSEESWAEAEINGAGPLLVSMRNTPICALVSTESRKRGISL